MDRPQEAVGSESLLGSRWKAVAGQMLPAGQLMITDSNKGSGRLAQRARCMTQGVQTFYVLDY